LVPAQRSSAEEAKPFVAGEGDCPSTPSRPRGWRSSEQGGEPLRKKRTDQAQGLARKGREGRCRFADLEGSRVLGEIGNCNLLGWRKYEKTLDLERIGKLAPEFFIAAQLLQFPLEAGKQEVALCIGHLFERFGGIHHKRGAGLVGSTERPGWE
jgi:hypothetical protein